MPYFDGACKYILGDTAYPGLSNVTVDFNDNIEYTLSLDKTHDNLHWIHLPFPHDPTQFSNEGQQLRHHLTQSGWIRKPFVIVEFHLGDYLHQLTSIGGQSTTNNNHTTLSLRACHAYGYNTSHVTSSIRSTQVLFKQAIVSRTLLPLLGHSYPVATDVTLDTYNAMVGIPFDSSLALRFDNATSNNPTDFINYTTAFSLYLTLFYGAAATPFAYIQRDINGVPLCWSAFAPIEETGGFPLYKDRFPTVTDLDLPSIIPSFSQFHDIYRKYEGFRNGIHLLTKVLTTRQTGLIADLVVLVFPIIAEALLTFSNHYHGIANPPDNLYWRKKVNRFYAYFPNFRRDRTFALMDKLRNNSAHRLLHGLDSRTLLETSYELMDSLASIIKEASGGTFQNEWRSSLTQPQFDVLIASLP